MNAALKQKVEMQKQPFKGEESDTGLNPEWRKKTILISCFISVSL